MKDYLILFSQVFPDFRKAELESLADLYNVPLDISHHDPASPFLIVQLEDDDQAKKIMHRAVLSRRIYELWGHGDTLELLHEDVRSRMSDRFEQYKTTSFKFDIMSFSGKRSSSEKRDMINSFEYTGWEGPIDMKTPDNIFTILEQYPAVGGNTRQTTPLHLFFGREVQQSMREDNVIQTYDLKKRKYIGTTSFDAELSLVTANLAQVDTGKIVYDPFAGTGSFLVAAAQFGGVVLGSDIDSRSLRGKGPGKDIHANFAQYGKSIQLMDLVGMDFTHNALRPSFGIDAIICDPPYGVREGLKVCGAKNTDKAAGRENVVIDGEKAHLRRDFIAPKKPYSLSSMLEDLLEFAATRLPVGGRLGFWMPTANDDFEDTLIPQHQRLEVLYCLEQEFNKWSRRLVIYVKRDEQWQNENRNGLKEKGITEFRDRYFVSFRKEKKEENEDKEEKEIKGNQEKENA